MSADTDHGAPADHPARQAAAPGVCTLPADPAAALDTLLSDRDKFRNLFEGAHTRLMHELIDMPGTESARNRLWRAIAGAEAADLASTEALLLLQAWVRNLGGVVDVAARSGAGHE